MRVLTSETSRTIRDNQSKFYVGLYMNSLLAGRPFLCTSVPDRPSVVSAVSAASAVFAPCALRLYVTVETEALLAARILLRERQGAEILMNDEVCFCSFLCTWF